MPLAEFQEQFPVLCGQLLHVKRTDRVGHAYLIVGDDHEFLRRFVAAWLQVCVCATPAADGDACGRCKTCRQIAEGNYALRYDLRPQSKSRTITIDDMRGLEHQLSLAVADRALKIGVIEDAECLGDAAQNAFLKTLEEPTGRTLLVLMTTQPRELLPTVRSRCQTVSLLRNRRIYALARQSGLFPILATLRRTAGAGVGVAAARRLGEIFGSLKAQALSALGEGIDVRWKAVAADDKALRKRLEEEHEARVQAEYLRLRQEIGDAIHAWFLQLLLLAAGAAAGHLPHPEFLEAAGVAPDAVAPNDVLEAQENVDSAARLLGTLAANVDERLALQAFCLAVTAK